MLAAIPLLALIIPLLLGRFPGEQVIERLAGRGTRRSSPPKRVAVARPRPVAVRTLLRARLLMAASFAERPPPAFTTAS